MHKETEKSLRLDDIVLLLGSLSRQGFFILSQDTIIAYYVPHGCSQDGGMVKDTTLVSEVVGSSPAGSSRIECEKL